MSKRKERTYQVEKIVGYREVQGKDQYRVHWSGYSASHDSWEPESNLLNCKDLIEDYMEKQAAKTRRRSRRVADTSTVLLSSGDELEESTKKVGRPKKTRNPPVTTVKASPAKKSLNRSYDLRSATKGFSAEITFSSDEEDGTPAKKTGPVKPRMTLSESKFKKQLTVNSKTASVIKASTPNKTTTRTQRKEDTPVKTRLEFDTEKRVGVQTRSMLRKQQEENDSFIAEASESDENGTTTKSKKEENETYPSWPEVGWKEFALAAVITATAAVGYICYSTDLCKYC